MQTFRVPMPEWRIDDARSIRTLAFSPDGARIAVAVNQVIAVLDASGKELLRFDATDPPPPPSFDQMRFGGGPPEFRAVEAIAFTPDGKWIVSGGEDMAVKVWETSTGKLVMRLGETGSSVEQVAVAPDGRTAYTAGSDGFVDQWDLTPDALAKPQGVTPTLPELWVAAGEHDPVRGVPAAWALVHSEEGRAYLVKKLPPAALLAPAQIDKWLAALDAPEFTDRDAATAALAACGRRVEPQLRQIVTTGKIEVQRRAQTLLARLQKYTTDEIRAMRIVKACAHSAAPGACDLLKRWATGAPGAVLTEDARAALKRRTSPH